MGSRPRKKRSWAGFFWRHLGWVIVALLAVPTGSMIWRAWRMGFPEAMPLIPPIATYLVIMALILSIHYIVIRGLSRGIKQGMSEPPAPREANKADEIASTVGRKTGRYAGIAGRALSKHTREARRVTQAGAQVIRKSLAEKSENSASET